MGLKAVQVTAKWKQVGHSNDKKIKLFLTFDIPKIDFFLKRSFETRVRPIAKLFLRKKIQKCTRDFFLSTFFHYPSNRLFRTKWVKLEKSEWESEER